MVFLTDLRKHDGIVKSINQTEGLEEPLREGYLTTQVAFSYFKNEIGVSTMSENTMGLETWLYPSICWLSHRAWCRLEVSHMTAANGGGGFTGLSHFYHFNRFPAPAG